MLEVLKYPDPRLKEVAKPVKKFDEELHRLLDAMAETMYASNGIGLAATQVGKPLRLFVVDLALQEGQPRKLYEFINPQISRGEGRITYEEGCLSVPGVAEEVVRKAKITVNYQDRHGRPQIMEADELLAVCIQHENDHLDGVLFIERLNPLKRRLVKRQLAKAAAAPAI